jgi:hypothetical protein
MVTNADTADSPNQPNASSTRLDARISCPMLRCSSRISARVFAMTGMALTAMATPRKQANVPRLPALPISNEGSSNPAPTPSTSGTTSPTSPTRSTVRVCRVISPKSTCTPLSPTSSSTPIWPIPSMRCDCAGSTGSSQPCIADATCPSNDGPSRIPAHSSPATAGSPAIVARLPSSSAAPSRTAI